MTFRVEVGGRMRVVDVRRTDRGFEATIDGRSLTVDLAATPAGWSLLLAGPGAAPDDPRRSYEVTLDEQPHGTTVRVDGVAVPVAVAGARRFGRGAAAAGAVADGPTRIVTPMPGRIVKVLVRPGEAVAARQPLIVVEAMKMENELRAPGPGTVSEVRVGEGASVEANAVLIVIS